MKDALGYYQILQVSQEADDDEIKNAYRRLAKQWHPDSNPALEAAEKFRQISKAYEVLSNDWERKVYDVLSLACNKDNYPDVKELALAVDMREDVNLKVIDLYINDAWFSGCQQQHIQKAVSYITAKKMLADAALTNWFKGWWHYKTFIHNIYALFHNLFNPIDKKATLRMLISNMVVSAKDKKSDKALQYGVLACRYLNLNERSVIKKFLAPFGEVRMQSVQWPHRGLLLAQLPYWGIFTLFLLLIIGGIWLNERRNVDKPINYYQNVKTAYGDIADDMVVGKILNIPVDLSDESKLYHLQGQQKVMYGPSEKFDIIKIMPDKTTVRLTGLTPDNVWARVMIDNGEMGFVKLNTLSKGRGIEPPFGSKIVE